MPFIKYLSLLSITCLWCVSCSPTENAAPPQSRQPKIILIMADDLGWGELGCYGQKWIQTPNLDRLAAEGIRLTQFYSGSAVCAPARDNLLTGRHAGHADVCNNREIKNPKTGVAPHMFGGQFPLADDRVTLAEVMKSRGYVTGAFGKWGLGAVGTEGDPLNQGFDRFYGFNCQRHAHNLYPKYLVDDRKNVLLEGNTRGVTGKQYAPQLIADQMLQFVRQHQDEPFFSTIQPLSPTSRYRCRMNT